jgi:hypothetical protein
MPVTEGEGTEKAGTKKRTSWAAHSGYFIPKGINVILRPFITLTNKIMNPKYANINTCEQIATDNISQVYTYNFSEPELIIQI